MEPWADALSDTHTELKVIITLVLESYFSHHYLTWFNNTGGDKGDGLNIEKRKGMRGTEEDLKKTQPEMKRRICHGTDLPEIKIFRSLTLNRSNAFFLQLQRLKIGIVLEICPNCKRKR